MNKPLITDEAFRGIDYTKNRLPRGEYENCVFTGCNFSDSYLDNQNFMECEFVDCNLSNANLSHSIFTEVTFDYCKMIGLKFEACSDFLMSFTFNNCDLNFASFYQVQLKNQTFNSCRLMETDFTQAKLNGAVFPNCDLQNAVFDETILEKADFRTAFNFKIDPERNRLKNAKFTKDGIAGLLGKYHLIIE